MLYKEHKLTHSYTQTSKCGKSTNVYIVVCVLWCMVERITIVALD